MALGAAISVWGYATPRIAGLQRQMADMKAADAQQTASFMMATAVKQAQLQAQADQAEAKYVALQADTAKRVASVSADNVSLRKSIATYTASVAFKLPTAGQTLPAAADSSKAAWGLLSTCLDVANASATDAERLADQVRALQALQ